MRRALLSFLLGFSSFLFQLLWILVARAAKPRITSHESPRAWRELVRPNSK